jgi:hypothetical protein
MRSRRQSTDVRNYGYKDNKKLICKEYNKHKMAMMLMILIFPDMLNFYTNNILYINIICCMKSIIRSSFISYQSYRLYRFCGLYRLYRTYRTYRTYRFCGYIDYIDYIDFVDYIDHIDYIELIGLIGLIDFADI